MALSVDRAKEIRAYIESHKTCKSKGFQALEIAGKRMDLDVYRLPTSLMRFNIRNGRFAAEYREHKSKLGRELDANSNEDIDRIKKMLLEQDKNATDVLRADLKKVGQRMPGVITFDGFLINGNRRKAVFDELLKTEGDSKWEYMEVAILPPESTEQDVWRIEAGLQFSREERLDYGPINKLLKFKEGIEAGIEPQQIASTLYGGFTAQEIEEDLKRLELIESYLDFVGKHGHYKTAEGLNEHFIDLRNFIQKEDKRGAPKVETMKVVKFAFDLIRNGVPHLDLRDIAKVMKQEASRKNLLKEIDTNPEISAIVHPKKDFSAPVPSTPAPAASVTSTPVTKPVEPPKPVELPKPKGKDAVSVQVFRDSVDMADAAEESNKPATLLKRALTNLNNINTVTLKKNSDAKVLQLVDEVDKTVEKIKQALAQK